MVSLKKIRSLLNMCDVYESHEFTMEFVTLRIGTPDFDDFFKDVKWPIFLAKFEGDRNRSCSSGVIAKKSSQIGVTFFEKI